MLDLNSKSTTRQYLFSFRKARESFVRTQKQEKKEIKKWLKTFESRDEVRWAEPRFLRLDWARIWMNPKNIYLLARPVVIPAKFIPKKLILKALGTKPRALWCRIHQFPLELWDRTWMGQCQECPLPSSSSINSVFLHRLLQVKMSGAIFQ